MGSRVRLYDHEVGKNSTGWLLKTIGRLTLDSMIIYLDYAAVFPYTGGEIVYVGLALKIWGTSC